MTRTSAQRQDFQVAGQASGPTTVWTEIEQISSSAAAAIATNGRRWASDVNTHVSPAAAALKVISLRILRVAPFVLLSLAVHALALSIAQRVYAPYSIPGVGYVNESTSGDTIRPRATVPSPSRPPSRRRG